MLNPEKNLNVEQVSGHKTRFIAKKLLAINSCWEMNSQFPLSVCPQQTDHAPEEGHIVKTSKIGHYNNKIKS